MTARPFSHVVVLNRGEAAVRFLRAARHWRREHRLPLRILALYTHPDADAPFVRMASSAICLGDALVAGNGGQVRSAYLDIERVVRLAKAAGADALWPGWGFAAERPELPEACEAHGLVFLGPSAGAMRLLGDKVAAKRLAEQNGVPVSPWSGGAVDHATALAVAERIGYPVLLKAAAGGGGRGIRRVASPAELEDALRAAANEAAAAFGDASVFVEAFVAEARHIEVQILADTHGGVWALGTRDCSMQRRQQKVFEEAPAPGLAPEVEAAICEAAIALARAVGYVGAGTAEFLLLPDERTFYFLEMNTRLQVEHTVTEEVYGVDLVGAQIDIARGDPLPAPHPPAPRGVAIEARLNAEDPDEGFAPRAGRLVRFSAPQGPGIRVDSGYETGSLVPTAFDSMLAKVIAGGANRRQAMARLETALRDTVVILDSGLTNRSLLLELVSASAFRDGPVTTRWLDGHLAQRPAPGARQLLEVALATAALGDYVRLRRGHLANFLDEAQRGLPRTVPEPGPTAIRYLLDRQPLQVEVATLGPEQLHMRCGDWEALVRAHQTGERTLVVELGGHRYSNQRSATATDVYVEVEGVAHRFRRLSDGRVRAALPASVSQVHVQAGERVTSGARLVTLEAMKMESVVESPLAGTVRAVHVRPSGQVAAGEVMVEIEEAGAGTTPAGEPLPPPPLPPRREPGLDALGVLEARLLGFDVTEGDAAAARAVLDRDPSPPRGRLLRLLRAAVVQDQLFKSGPYDDARNDAKESSLDQLAWCVHHRHLDAEHLSPRFIRRMQRFLDLHGVDDVERDTRGVEHALLRLFQARRSPEETSAIVLTVLHALARSSADQGVPMPPPTDQRVIFEKLANEAVQRHDLQVATAAWNLIYHWYDRPEQREEAVAFAEQARTLFARLLAAPAPAARAEAQAALLALPLAPLVSLLAGAEAQRTPSLALQLLLEAVYGEGDQDEVAPLLGRLPCRHLWAARGTRIVAALVAAPEDLAAAVEALPPDAEADLLLGFVPADRALEEAAGLARPRWTALWTEDGEMRARTWVPAPGGPMRAHELLRDFHPARPVARELARFSAFTLSRLPAPTGLLLLRAVAPGDERLLALAEVERFDPQIQGHFVRVPALEKVFLDAVQALRSGLRAATGRPPALNRIALCVRPVVTLSREHLLTLAQRLGPSTSDLGLEKVSLLGRFTLGDTQPPREHAVEWRDPVGLGPRVDVVMPRHRPVAVRTSYEQQVLAARRRRLFYPYELVNWLTSREGAAGIERGRFEELELDDGGTRLESVHGRPWGENRANLVVGLITNWSVRFPDGLRRVLIIGDPTREMGALGEAECRRIVAAIDYAEQLQLPVEWVALSAGARIAFDSGTENLDWTAAVLRRVVEFTARGGVIHVIVDGPCVGAQSYWNAEATMLGHCRGTLIMTPRGYMVLTGKRALEVSGSVAAPTNEQIGGLEIMEPNGEAQYTASDLHGAYEVLLRHYDYTYVGAGERYARRVPTSDPVTRDVTVLPYSGPGGFTRLGELFEEGANPGRKKPFAIREVLRAVLDQDAPPLERWGRMAGGETAVVMHGQLGGQPVCMIGVESQPLPRRGQRPIDGPATWMSGTLFPHSSRKIARAIRASSGVCPVVVLANLSGFDGSPESLRERQLEYGAEIGKAVVEFDGPILFCVIARYHGGAYVVFSRRLSPHLDAVALEGSYASVIGGGAAAAVVFTRLVADRVQADPRVAAARQALAAASHDDARRLAQEQYEAVLADAEAEVQAAVGREFDAVHSVARAMEVGSLDAVLPTWELRPALCARLAGAVERYLESPAVPA
jgi:acetyl/propionyl-CoA carboxylase alpha subunit/acetyl-CoA carboxylase carboxyltransferase component